MSFLTLSETPKIAKWTKNIEKRSVWEIARGSTKASHGLQTLYFTTFFAPPALPTMCRMSANLANCSSKQDPGVKTIVFCSVWHLPEWALWTMPGARPKLEDPVASSNLTKKYKIVQNAVPHYNLRRFEHFGASHEPRVHKRKVFFLEKQAHLHWDQSAQTLHFSVFWPWCHFWGASSPLRKCVKTL